MWDRKNILEGSPKVLSWKISFMENLSKKYCPQAAHCLSNIYFKLQSSSWRVCLNIMSWINFLSTTCVRREEKTLARVKNKYKKIGHPCQSSLGGWKYSLASVVIKFEKDIYGRQRSSLQVRQRNQVFTLLSPEITIQHDRNLCSYQALKPPCPYSSSEPDAV